MMGEERGRGGGRHAYCVLGWSEGFLLFKPTGVLLIPSDRDISPLKSLLTAVVKGSCWLSLGNRSTAHQFFLENPFSQNSNPLLKPQSQCFSSSKFPIKEILPFNESPSLGFALFRDIGLGAFLVYCAHAARL